MVALLDRPGAPPPVDSTQEVEEYSCDCDGFKQKYIEKMCLRCLEAYTAGLPYVLSGVALTKEMRRAAYRLAAILQDDPLMANLPLDAALRAAER